MIRSGLPAVATLALLSACTGGGTARPAATPAPVARPPALPAAGLDRVMGRDARALVSLFGPANQDAREPGARRLQFSGPICILDAYLYPPAQGKEPVVTHVDARQHDGRDIDRASCVAALTRRTEAQ